MKIMNKEGKDRKKKEGDGKNVERKKKEKN